MQVTSIRHGTDPGLLPFLMRYQFVREGDAANYLSPDELHANVFPPEPGDLTGGPGFKVYVTAGNGHQAARFQQATNIARSFGKVRLHFRTPDHVDHSRAMSAIQPVARRGVSTGPFSFRLVLSPCWVANLPVLSTEGVSLLFVGEGVELTGNAPPPIAEEYWMWMTSRNSLNDRHISKNGSV